MSQIALATNQAEGCEHAWHPNVKSEEFNLLLKQTRMFLAIEGACVDDVKAFMVQKSGFAPAEMTFQYHYMSKTFSQGSCDKVLTLSTCDEDGRITIESADANKYQKWEVRDGGRILSVDCPGPSEFFMATKETGKYKSGQYGSEIGVTTDDSNWEAIFDMYFIDDELND